MIIVPWILLGLNIEEDWNFNFNILQNAYGHLDQERIANDAHSTRVASIPKRRRRGSPHYNLVFIVN